MDIESKQGRLNSGAELVFKFLTDLRNLDGFIPSDKVQNWVSTTDSCSFTIPQAGDIRLRITRKEEFRLIKVEPESGSPVPFAFYIQLHAVDAFDTRIKLTFRSEMNQMMKIMLKSPLQKGLDQIVDTITGLPENIFNQ